MRKWGDSCRSRKRSLPWSRRRIPFAKGLEQLRQSVEGGKQFSGRESSLTEGRDWHFPSFCSEGSLQFQAKVCQPFPLQPFLSPTSWSVMPSELVRNISELKALRLFFCCSFFFLNSLDLFMETFLLVPQGKHPPTCPKVYLPCYITSTLWDLEDFCQPTQ